MGADGGQSHARRIVGWPRRAWNAAVLLGLWMAVIPSALGDEPITTPEGESVVVEHIIKHGAFGFDYYAYFDRNGNEVFHGVYRHIYPGGLVKELTTYAHGVRHGRFVKRTDDGPTEVEGAARCNPWTAPYETREWFGLTVRQNKNMNRRSSAPRLGLTLGSRFLIMIPSMYSSRSMRGARGLFVPVVLVPAGGPVLQGEAHQADRAEALGQRLVAELGSAVGAPGWVWHGRSSRRLEGCCLGLNHGIISET